MNTVEHNRLAWNEQSRWGSPWCDPVTSEEIELARAGQWSVILTPNLAVPSAWFGELQDAKLLCLASGGGQQGPILAAAGAMVTSFDNSDEQLAKDQRVAARDGLDIKLERGDMADLSRFENETFDIIFHPVSNLFAGKPAAGLAGGRTGAETRRTSHVRFLQPHALPFRSR